MSANEHPVQTTGTATAQTLPDDRYSRLHDYLNERVKESDAGEVYLKSKFIAEEVGLSARQIGALIPKLQDMEIKVDIEKWSYTGATTWRVTPSQ